MPLCCIVFVFEGARPSRAYLQSFPQLSCSFENQLESCTIVEESCHLVTSFNIPCAHNATGTVSITVTWSTASSTKKSKGHLRRSSASFRIAASCATHACEWLPHAGIIHASPCGLIPHFPACATSACRWVQWTAACTHHPWWRKKRFVAHFRFMCHKCM